MTKKILVVEDDLALARLFLAALKAEGWRGVIAGSGHEALTTVAARPPDAIVLDLLLPDMDGLQLIDMLHALPEGFAGPIIIVTASDLSGEARARLQGSVNQILRKGEHTLAQLTLQLHACLDSRTSSSPPRASMERRHD